MERFPTGVEPLAKNRLDTWPVEAELVGLDLFIVWCLNVRLHATSLHARHERVAGVCLPFFADILFVNPSREVSSMATQDIASGLWKALDPNGKVTQQHMQ